MFYVHLLVSAQVRQFGRVRGQDPAGSEPEGGPVGRSGGSSEEGRPQGGPRGMNLCYMMEVCGPMLPHAVEGLSHLLADTQHDFTASYSVHDPCIPLNILRTHRIKAKQDHRQRILDSDKSNLNGSLQVKGCHSVLSDSSALLQDSAPHRAHFSSPMSCAVEGHCCGFSLSHEVPEADAKRLGPEPPRNDAKGMGPETPWADAKRLGPETPWADVQSAGSMDVHESRMGNAAIRELRCLRGRFTWTL